MNLFFWSSHCRSQRPSLPIALCRQGATPCRSLRHHETSKATSWLMMSCWAALTLRYALESDQFVFIFCFFSVHMISCQMAFQSDDHETPRNKCHTLSYFIHVVWTSLQIGEFKQCWKRQCFLWPTYSKCLRAKQHRISCGGLPFDHLGYLGSFEMEIVPSKPDVCPPRRTSLLYVFVVFSRTGKNTWFRGGQTSGLQHSSFAASLGASVSRVTSCMQNNVSLCKDLRQYVWTCKTHLHLIIKSKHDARWWYRVLRNKMWAIGDAIRASFPFDINVPCNFWEVERITQKTGMTLTVVSGWHGNFKPF